MNEKAKVYALRTFAKKDTGEIFYVVECVSAQQNETPNFIGVNQVTVFISKEQYQTLLANFKLFMEVTLNVMLQGNRAKYSLAL